MVLNPVGNLGAALCLAMAATTGFAQPVPPPGNAASLGASTYATHCAACHQPTGKGVPGAFPPLAGHAAKLAAQGGGRGYLMRVVLFGMEGPITVDGQPYSGAMPAWGALDDGALAAVLNQITTAWNSNMALPAGFQPYQPQEVAAARAEALTAAQVHAIRVTPGSEATPKSAPTANATPATSVPVPFTAEQAGQGQVAYDHSCKDCHGSSLDNGEFGGAPLRGSYFRKKWGSGSVAALYGYMKTKMPPDRPGALSDKVYADLVAFVLEANGYKPGDRQLPANVDAQLPMSLKLD